MNRISLALLVLFSAFTAGCPSTQPCSPSTCSTGCCDSAGRCQTSSMSTCGERGATCQACPLSTSCIAGACVTTGSTGGGFSGTGGGSSVTGGGNAAGGAAAGGNTTAGGNAGGGSSSDAGPSSAYERFLESAAQGWCDELLRCGRATSTQGCRETFFSSSFPSPFAPPRSVRTGTATFDPVLAARCLASFDGGCGDSNCFGVTSPAADGGGLCFSQRDCLDPTLHCNGVVCNRQCSRSRALGDGCDSDRDCDPSLACVDFSCRPVPFGASCTVRGNDYQGCGSLHACLTPDGGQYGPDTRCVRRPSTGPCLPFAQCAPDAFCDSTNQCRPLLARGAACQSDRQCQPQDFCNGVCTARRTSGATCMSGVFSRQCADGLDCLVGRCLPPIPRGGTCFGAEQRLNGGCEPGTFCDAVSLRCDSSRGVGLGEACSNVRGCLEGRCRGLVFIDDGGASVGGVCGPSQPGDPCFGNSDCQNGTYCQGSQCRAAGAATPCTSASNCLPGSICTSGTCAPPPGNGQSCVEFQPCADPRQACLPSPTGPRCQPVPTLGQPCTTQCQLPAACQGGTCVAGGRPGQPCLRSQFGTTCIEGECIFNNDGGTNCSTRQPLGASCSHDDACASAYCDFDSFRGVCAPGLCR